MIRKIPFDVRTILSMPMTDIDAHPSCGSKSRYGNQCQDSKKMEHTTTTTIIIKEEEEEEMLGL